MNKTKIKKIFRPMGNYDPFIRLNKICLCYNSKLILMKLIYICKEKYVVC